MHLNSWTLRSGSEHIQLGFPFYVKNFITRNIVGDVTDSHYVGITVVMTLQETCGIITQNIKES
jgi:hypothetical protein